MQDYYKSIDAEMQRESGICWCWILSGGVLPIGVRLCECQTRLGCDGRRRGVVVMAGVVALGGRGGEFWRWWEEALSLQSYVVMMAFR
jgi:hypothetical protein